MARLLQNWQSHTKYLESGEVFQECYRDFEGPSIEGSVCIPSRLSGNELNRSLNKKNAKSTLCIVSHFELLDHLNFIGVKFQM